MNTKLNVLLLCDLPRYATNANTLFDHAYALRDLSRHNVKIYSGKGPIPYWLDLNKFDVIVIHYTHFILGDSYLSEGAKRKIAAFNGLKAIFIQDEYRFVRPINREMAKMGIHLIYSCIEGEAALKEVYPESILGPVSIKTVLTGYVPHSAAKAPSAPLAERPLTVTYRGRKLPFWYGSVAQEKWDLVPRFLEAASVRPATRGWKMDLSYHEHDRIYGDAWVKFLEDSRVSLGVESAASVFDFEGTLAGPVEDYQARFPEATFEEVAAKFFPGEDKRIYLRCISPRCFESIAARTAMVLMEGEYSRILKPGVHYISLKKDLSNFDEVVDAINDVPRLQAMVDRAYEDVIASGAWGYSKLAQAFDEGIEAEFSKRGWVPKMIEIDAAEFERQCRAEQLRHRAASIANGIRDAYSEGGVLHVIGWIGIRILRKINYRIHRILRIPYLGLKSTPVVGPVVYNLKKKLR